jgi:DNA repair protein RadC
VQRAQKACARMRRCISDATKKATTLPSDPSNLSIHDLPDDERPRERLLAHGASSLSNAELLAIILRTGTAQENALRLSQRLLSHYGGLDGLAQASASSLAQTKGVGSAKTAQIMAALELGRRLMTHPAEQRPLVANASDAAKLVMDMGTLAQEHVRVILLDSARRMIAIQTVYIGTLNASVMRVAELYREAITRNCPVMIVAHNHPSGDPNPSPEDVELTRILVAAGNLLDITLLDHLIIAQQRWVSLRDLGLGF